MGNLHTQKQVQVGLTFWKTPLLFLTSSPFFYPYINSFILSFIIQLHTMALSINNDNHYNAMNKETQKYVLSLGGIAALTCWTLFRSQLLL